MILISRTIKCVAVPLSSSLRSSRCAVSSTDEETPHPTIPAELAKSSAKTAKYLIKLPKIYFDPSASNTIDYLPQHCISFLSSFFKGPIKPSPKEVKVLRYLIKLALSFLAMAAPKAFAAKSEMATGFLLGQFTPSYPTELSTTPALPKTFLAKGVDATYLKHNVLLGCRAWYGTSHAGDNTAGTHYSVGVVNLLIGTGADFGGMDFNLGTGLGIGTMSFANINATTPLSVDAAIISAEPTGSLGISLTEEFKISAGGSYLYGYVHEVNQDGPTASQIATPTEKIKVTGVFIFFKFSAVLN